MTKSNWEPFKIVRHEASVWKLAEEQIGWKQSCQTLPSSKGQAAYILGTVGHIMAIITNLAALEWKQP